VSDVEEDHVWQHSPYKGAAKLIHLRMAKLANEEHQWRLWVGDRYLATAASCNEKTVRTARAKMIADGLLEPHGVDRRSGNREYIFVRQAAPVKTAGADRTFATDRPDIHDSAPLTNRTEQKDARDVIEIEFDEVWMHYPKKRARKAALEAFSVRRRSGVSLADLISATRHYAASTAGSDERFIMHGSRFYGPNEEFVDYIAGPPSTFADSPLSEAERFVPGLANSSASDDEVIEEIDCQFANDPESHQEAVRILNRIRHPEQAS
jgi:hypothetical protein